MTEVSKPYSISIYNSIGVQVTSDSSDLDNYILNGSKLSSGVYYVIVKDADYHTWKGSVVKK